MHLRHWATKANDCGTLNQYITPRKESAIWVLLRCMGTLYAKPKAAHSFIHSFIHSLIHSFTHSLTHSLIHSFIAICKAHYVENVESEALEAVARWSIIGIVVSFKLRVLILKRDN